MSVFIGYWYAAIGEDIGLVLATNNPQAMIQKLYAARREALDSTLDTLSIIQSPTVAGEIWIVKRVGRQSAPQTLSEMQL